MIKINGKEYNDYKTEITWGTFNVNSNGQKIIGVSPFITFKLENDVFMGLELTFLDKIYVNYLFM